MRLLVNETSTVTFTDSVQLVLHLVDASEDDEEDGEVKEEDYKEGEEGVDDEGENAELAQTKTASPAYVP